MLAHVRRAVSAGVLAALAAVPVAVAPSAKAGLRPRTAPQHLEAILERSRPPEYRRAGSEGMRTVHRYVDERLSQAGYGVAHVDVPFARYEVDYTRGHQPALTRVSDGRSFKTESAFYLGRTTGARGITCTARAVADVRPGDCGFVSFPDASPE